MATDSAQLTIDQERDSILHAIWKLERHLDQRKHFGGDEQRPRLCIYGAPRYHHPRAANIAAERTPRERNFQLRANMVTRYDAWWLFGAGDTEEGA